MYILRGGQDQHDYGEYVVYLKFDQEIVTTESFFGQEMSKQRIETGQGIVTCHAGKHSTLNTTASEPAKNSEAELYVTGVDTHPPVCRHTSSSLEWTHILPSE